MNKLIACTGLVMALFVSGCTLYFGEDRDNEVQVSHYCDGVAEATTCYTCYTQPDGYQECFPDGYGCTTDSGCASGCYCEESSGSCIEAGYCASDAECGYGLECDCSGSCIPVNTGTRSCQPDSCWTTGCPTGYVCTAEGSCVPEQPLPPLSCNSDVDCAAGCYCVNGLCEESSVFKVSRASGAFRSVFKVQAGHRVFRMTPLHHHFEMLGWEQVTIVIRFWIITGLCVATGIGIFYAEWVAGIG